MQRNLSQLKTSALRISPVRRGEAIAMITIVIPTVRDPSNVELTIVGIFQGRVYGVLDMIAAIIQVSEYTICRFASVSQV